MQVRVITNITKVYPDMIKVVIFKTPQYYSYEEEGRVKRNKSDVIDGSYAPKITSLNRTKTLVKDIVLCNDFDLFCTFTFDPDKVNRYDLYACWGKMSRWLHHQRENSRDFAYLIIPEQHKDGAYHFHALLKNFKGTLKDSKHKSSSGRPVYNITCYRSGFSTAVGIDSKEAVASYVTKYITKQFVKLFNQRRFFCSRNLIRPQKEINSNLFRLTPPLFRKKLNEDLITETYSIDI